MSGLLLRVELLEGGIAPARMSANAAGYDLSTPNKLIIAPNSTQLVPLKIKIAIPNGYHGQIWPRSSLDSKKCITTAAGIIDSDYRGELMVLLRSHNNQEVTIDQNDRIAQLIIVPHAEPAIEIVPNLSETVRGQGGFGSTGV